MFFGIGCYSSSYFADNSTPDLIIGHGALGRLLARLTVLRGKSPIVVDKTANRLVVLWDTKFALQGKWLENNLVALLMLVETLVNLIF